MLHDGIAFKRVALPIDHVVAGTHKCIYMSDETAIVVNFEAAASADKCECVDWRLGSAGIIRICGMCLLGLLGSF
jgi:hypothetical protein